MDALSEYMVWNNSILESGVHPLVDHTGRPFPDGSKRNKRAGTALAGGWRASFVTWLGDQKEKKLVHKSPHWFRAKKICDKCEASVAHDATYPAYEFGVCKWSDTLKTRAVYDDEQALVPH